MGSGRGSGGPLLRANGCSKAAGFSDQSPPRLGRPSCPGPLACGLGLALSHGRRRCQGWEPGWDEGRWCPLLSHMCHQGGKRGCGELQASGQRSPGTRRVRPRPVRLASLILQTRSQEVPGALGQSLGS